MKLTDAQRADLHRRLAAVGIGPCTDGGCIFVHPGGMRTNGGCGHLKGIRPAANLARAAIVLREYAAESRALVTFAEGLTVGAALALPEVQRGEAVVECLVAEDRLQIRANGSGYEQRWYCGRWRAWSQMVLLHDEASSFCRLVPLADCDADPSTREGGSNG